MSMLRRRMMMASKTGASEETEGLSDYFHVISHEDQTIAFLIDCQYNLDDGNGWVDLHYDTEINLPKDAIIYVTALADEYSNIMLEYAENISLAGNIMSLVYGHDFRDKYSLEGFDYIFAGFASSEINALAIKSIDKLLLPATTLSCGCYSYMFNGCENITKTPVLPATILEEYCYIGMFSYCEKLNYIKMLATDISADDCLTSWVEKVSSTGTFVKHPEATWDTTPGALGDSGVPAGWTIKFDGEEGGDGKIDNRATLYTSNMEWLIQFDYPVNSFLNIIFEEGSMYMGKGTQRTTTGYLSFDQIKIVAIEPSSDDMYNYVF